MGSTAAGSSARLEFTRFDASNAGSLAVLVGTLQSRSGIYWLTFDDGSEYVGQSVEVVNRLATHRRHQNGQIVSVAFAPVAPDDLDRAERWFIEDRDCHGANLRNKLITRAPGGPGPGAVTIRPGVTVSLPWDRAQRTPITTATNAPTASATALQDRQWAQLQAHQSWPGIRRFLRAYLRETMSAPDLTAGRLWTVSAMPNTSPLPGWRRLCTLNVGRIEALYIGQDATAGTVVHWNIAVPTETELARLTSDLDKMDPYHQIGAEIHEHYSESVCALAILGPELAHRVLELCQIADLAYQFNTRYQRQGMALQSRWHNSRMAADLLAR